LQLETLAKGQECEKNGVNISSDQHKHMGSLLRKVPLTPLDTLRALLGEYADGNAAFAGRLASMLQTLRKQALVELGGRLAPSASPRGLRRAIIGCMGKFDWPEWTPHLLEALKAEPDLGVFDEGCAALGGLGIRDAYEALVQLQKVRTQNDHQTILARELALYQTQQGLGQCLARLNEGQANPRLAIQGARLLSTLANPDDVPALVEAYRDGDLLVQRLALRVLGSLPYPETVEFLLELMESSRQDHLDHRQLLEQLNRLQTLPRASVQPELLRQVATQFGAVAAKPVADLQAAAHREGGDLLGPLERIRPSARGVLQNFLLDVLVLVAEGKVARYSAMVSEAADAIDANLLNLANQCDQVAEALSFKVDKGELAWDRLQPVFANTFRTRAGGDGFIHAFLRLLPATETVLLDELLLDPDLTRRRRYLDALGTREDNALTPFFLKAMEDPIVEVGQEAIHHLGKLPASFPAIMAMFESGVVDQVRQAIWVFGENQTHMAAEPLLEFLQKEGRDPLLVEATEAITAIGYPGSAPVLLELLHDGKPLNLQVALATALGALGTEEGSLGLLAKAAQLKQPQVLILALEGALAAFAGFDRPLPLPQLPAFTQLLDRCMDDREGEGQRLRAILATENLFVFDRIVYEQLKERFSDNLFDMRTKEAWDRDSNDRVAAVVKELARRSEALGTLAHKEANLKALVHKIPSTGPRRVESLLALREALQDSELIIRPEIAREMAGLVLDNLERSSGEWRETAHLCEIAGLTHQPQLIDPIREVFQRASGLGLKSAARAALLALGLAEDDLNRRTPIGSILVLEPSAFFRKRLTGFLAQHGPWQLAEAGSRKEAEALLDSGPVDLLLTESQDPEGDLSPWLQDIWSRRRCRYAIISTSNRDIGDLAQAPWVVGILFKPYPMEQVIQALEP
jgi:HEAT repeat protein